MDYEEIVSFRENGSDRKFLSSPGSDSIFSSIDGVIQPYGLIPRFAVLNVNTAQSAPAKDLIKWCREWMVKNGKS